MPLSVSDCSTATNKAAYASRNKIKDQVSHMPSSRVAFIAYTLEFDDYTMK